MIRLWQFWKIAAADVRLLWFALHHPARPRWLMPATALLGLYAFEPLNFAIPVLGAVDDLLLLPLLLHGLVQCLPPAVRSDFSRRAVQ